jgi:hypothetical protein
MPIALLTEWMDWLFTAIPNQMELDALLQDGLITSSTTLYFSTLPLDSRVQNGYLQDQCTIKFTRNQRNFTNKKQIGLAQKYTRYVLTLSFCC